MAIEFQNYYGCSRSWNLLLSRANTLKNQVKSEGFCENRKFRFLNPEVPDFNSYITIWPVTYPFTPHSSSHILPDTSTVQERRFCGDSRIWPRISRGKDGTLVISIQRFRIHPPESISNPSHHEQRYKIIPFARSLYLGLICSIPLVGHLHLDHRCYP